MKVFSFLRLIPCVLLLAACATAPVRPATLPDLGAVLESLRAEISLSAVTPEGSTGGNGYFLYRRPDTFRIVLLSPFGMTMAEAFAQGDKITFSIPGRQTAYTGTFAELPAEGGMRAWRMLKGGVDVPTFVPAAAGATVRRTGPGGEGETLTYDQYGFLTEKRTDGGEVVTYDEYATVQGVAVPGVITFRNLSGAAATVRIREPEVNVGIDDENLRPNLDGFTILPFAAFTGS